MGANFFVIRTDWFFLLGINFCDFHKVLDKSLRIYIYIFFNTCNGNIKYMIQTIILGWVHPMHGKSSVYYCMFVNERDF